MLMMINRCRATNRQPVRILAALVAIGLLSAGNGMMPARAQTGNAHHLYDYEMPPGEVAWRKSLMRAASRGYFQPVDLVIPAGASVAVYSEGRFQPVQPGQLAGLMTGHIYRLRISEIPRHPGVELFPSVEILGRLIPPRGQAARCPLPVHISMEDIEPALAGDLVTRVVYLENPRNTLPDARQARDQAFIDAGPAQDPIRVAERFGRPLAIARTGSRIPDRAELEGFGFGTPPMRWLTAPQPPEPPATGTGTDPTGARQPENPVKPVAWQQPVHSGEGCSPWDVYGSACGCQSCGGQPGIGPPLETVPQNLQPWPDELLCDGGDRGLQVVARDRGDRWEIQGLDSEDTIAHFDTLDGRHLVDHSNRVCIYAPRFSAIRKIDRLGRTGFAQEFGMVNDRMNTDEERHEDFASTTLQQVQPKLNRGTLKARGMEDRTRGVLVDNTTQFKRVSGDFRTYEDLRLIKIGHYSSREKGRLNIAVQNAKVWDINVSAQSTTARMNVFVFDGEQAANELTGLRTKKGRPELRLVKIASTDVALPGDEIEFTIRFDNTGGETIGNVTIMDNLTTRLEYIADSTECSVDGRFSATANQSGSQTLSWELTDPLQVGEGGIIRFRCRVR